MAHRGTTPGVEDGVTRRSLLRAGAGAGAALALGGANALPALADGLAAAGRVGGAALGYSSLTDEVRLPDVPVEGELPRWLRGVLLRNGPALFEIGEQKLNHWFDGLAMLHAFAFGEGRVSYANRFLRSSAYVTWKRHGVMKYSEFGTDPDPDPCRALFNGVSSLPLLAPVPNANVSIEQLANRFRAHTEIPVPVRFRPGSLKTLGVDSEIPPGRLGTAHPHQDPHTGERLSYEIELIPPAGVRIISERRGRRRELAFIPQERPGYLHSFGLTPRWAIVFTNPWEFDIGRFLGPDRGPIASSFVWDDSKPSRVILVDRKRGGVAADIEVDPAFVFHHINAYEEGDRVVVDVCAHEDAAIIEALLLKNLRKGKPVPQAAPRRLIVDPARGTVKVRELAEGNIELPRKDYERVNARPYRYAYGIGVREPRSGRFVDRLSKLDVKRGEMIHWYERNAHPGEPIFVRRPGPGRREDDGVLLSVVLDGARGASSLLVLDARDMSEIARAPVPHHIPFGFHGHHAPA